MLLNIDLSGQPTNHLSYFLSYLMFTKVSTEYKTTTSKILNSLSERLRLPDDFSGDQSCFGLELLIDFDNKRNWNKNS